MALGNVLLRVIKSSDINDATRAMGRECRTQTIIRHWFPHNGAILLHRAILGLSCNGASARRYDKAPVQLGAYFRGFHGDCAATYPCGKISPEAQRLIDVTRQSFFQGLKFAKQGNRISDISHAIQTYVESNGYSVVRDFVGHGVGAQLHEEPEVRNFGAPGHGPRMLKGMTLAIEPMVNQGAYDVMVLKDKWTTVTADGSLSAHYENTVLITDGEPEILTVTEGL